MNLQQFEYVVAVAHSGSLTKASEQSNITLSAMSQSISALEKELAVSIFKRSKKGSQATAQGQVVIQYAKKITKVVNDMHQEIERTTTSANGVIRLATIPTAMHLLMQISTQFNQQQPDVQLAIVEKSGIDIIKAVQQNELDIGLLMIHPDMKLDLTGVNAQRLQTAKMLAVVPKMSCYGRKDKISPKELLTYPLVSYRDDFILWYFEEVICRYGSPNLRLSSNNTNALTKALHEGAATFGVDYSFVEVTRKKEQPLAFIPLDVPQNTVEMVMISQQGLGKRRVFQLFEKQLKQYFTAI